jgi:hypothetical protein
LLELPPLLDARAEKLLLELLPGTQRQFFLLFLLLLT